MAEGEDGRRLGEQVLLEEMREGLEIDHALQLVPPHNRKCK